VPRDVVFYEHVFPYQRVQDTSNETNNPNIYNQTLFTRDQPILSPSSQVILAPCDNVENNNNNKNYESDVEVTKEVCSHIDRNLIENHERKQNFECLNEY